MAEAQSILDALAKVAKQDEMIALLGGLASDTVLVAINNQMDTLIASGLSQEQALNAIQAAVESIDGKVATELTLQDIEALLLRQLDRFRTLLLYQAEVSEELLHGYDIDGNRYHFRAYSGASTTAPVWESVKFDNTEQRVTYSENIVVVDFVDCPCKEYPLPPAGPKEEPFQPFIDYLRCPEDPFKREYRHLDGYSATPGISYRFDQVILNRLTNRLYVPELSGPRDEKYDLESGTQTGGATFADGWKEGPYPGSSHQYPPRNWVYRKLLHDDAWWIDNPQASGGRGGNFLLPLRGRVKFNVTPYSLGSGQSVKVVGIPHFFSMTNYMKMDWLFHNPNPHLGQNEFTYTSIYFHYTEDGPTGEYYVYDPNLFYAQNYRISKEALWGKRTPSGHVSIETLHDGIEVEFAWDAFANFNPDDPNDCYGRVWLSINGINIPHLFKYGYGAQPRVNSYVQSLTTYTTSGAEWYEDMEWTIGKSNSTVRTNWIYTPAHRVLEGEPVPPTPVGPDQGEEIPKIHYGTSSRANLYDDFVEYANTGLGLTCGWLNNIQGKEIDNIEGGTVIEDLRGHPAKHLGPRPSSGMLAYRAALSEWKNYHFHFTDRYHSGVLYDNSALVPTGDYSIIGSRDKTIASGSGGPHIQFSMGSVGPDYVGVDEGDCAVLYWIREHVVPADDPRYAPNGELWYPEYKVRCRDTDTQAIVFHSVIWRPYEADNAENHFWLLQYDSAKKEYTFFVNDLYLGTQALPSNLEPLPPVEGESCILMQTHLSGAKGYRTTDNDTEGWQAGDPIVYRQWGEWYSVGSFLLYDYFMDYLDYHKLACAFAPVKAKGSALEYLFDREVS